MKSRHQTTDLQGKRRVVRVAILAHPKTPATGENSALAALNKLASTMDCDVTVARIITNDTIPVGQVYVAAADEPRVKKMASKKQKRSKHEDRGHSESNARS